MKAYTIMFEDNGNIILADEKGTLAEEKDEVLDYILMEQECRKIYSILRDEEGFFDQPEVLQNLDLIIKNYQIEMHASSELNHFNILGVKVAIYGDDSYGGVELHAYTDFDTYDDDDDRYRLMNISAGGNNRDGYAIKYVVERLKEPETDMKLMIIISDGQPADEGYYGQPAEADLKHICKEMDHDGIAYIAAAIGDDKETIKAIYGERHFLDISNLSRLPEDLVSLIRRLLR